MTVDDVVVVDDVVDAVAVVAVVVAIVVVAVDEAVDWDVASFVVELRVDVEVCSLSIVGVVEVVSAKANDVANKQIVNIKIINKKKVIVL